MKTRMLDGAEARGRFVALAGTLLLPGAVIRTCFPRNSRPTALYFIIQGASAVALVFCAICDGTLNTHSKNVLPYLPLCALIAPWSSSEWRGIHWIVPVEIVTGLSVVAVLIASFIAFKQTGELERASLSLPTPPKPGAPMPTPPAHAPLA